MPSSTGSAGDEAKQAFARMPGKILLDVAGRGGLGQRHQKYPSCFFAPWTRPRHPPSGPAARNSWPAAFSRITAGRVVRGAFVGGPVKG